jgi:thiosulfate reductase cytochrome b subunit
MQRYTRIKHPLFIRILHWLNVPVLAIMVWSGLLIYWAYDPYVVGFGRFSFHLFPRGRQGEFNLYRMLNLERRLAEGMAWHFTFAWAFTFIGIAYVAYTILSGAWRYLLPNRRSFREAVQVTLHDLHLRREAPPIGKYNGAQQIAYTGVIAMGAGSVLTGLAIYKPTQLHWLASLFGGYEWARWAHFWLMIGFIFFVIIHLAQVVRTGWNNFRGMIAGYEIEPNAVDQPSQMNARSEVA